jgi:protein gp37
VNDTTISWTKATWNPTFGCSKVAEECRFCYAETIALKFGHSKVPWTARNAPQNVGIRRHKLREPYALKEPSRVFVNSMSDLFHPEIPDGYRSEVFAVMADLPQHTFQVLTRRPELAAQWAGPWAPNIHMGVSVGTRKCLPWLETLRGCGASTLFVSFEPLLEDLGSPELSGYSWAIVGGESGMHMPQHPERWMDHAWARGIRDACLRDGVAFFFKQSSGRRTEIGTALEHEDGTLWVWHQFPGEMAEPVQVHAADDPAYRIPQRPGRSLLTAYGLRSDR